MRPSRIHRTLNPAARTEKSECAKRQQKEFFIEAPLPKDMKAILQQLRKIRK